MYCRSLSPTCKPHRSSQLQRNGLFRVYSGHPLFKSLKKSLHMLILLPPRYVFSARLCHLSQWSTRPLRRHSPAPTHKQDSPWQPETPGRREPCPLRARGERQEEGTVRGFTLDCPCRETDRWQASNSWLLGESQNRINAQNEAMQGHWIDFLQNTPFSGGHGCL